MEYKGYIKKIFISLFPKPTSKTVKKKVKKKSFKMQSFLIMLCIALARGDFFPLANLLNWRSSSEMHSSEIDPASPSMNLLSVVKQKRPWPILEPHSGSAPAEITKEKNPEKDMEEIQTLDSSDSINLLSVVKQQRPWPILKPHSGSAPAEIAKEKNPEKDMEEAEQSLTKSIEESFSASESDKPAETAPNTEKKPESRSVPLARTNVSVKPVSSSTPRQVFNVSRPGDAASMIKSLGAAISQYIEASKLWLSKLVEIFNGSTSSRKESYFA